MLCVRNIEACRGLAVIDSNFSGPNAMNKLVVNHLEKIFVTWDAASDSAGASKLRILRHVC